jgi:hypothetical protein
VQLPDGTAIPCVLLANKVSFHHWMQKTELMPLASNKHQINILRKYFSLSVLACRSSDLYVSGHVAYKIFSSESINLRSQVFMVVFGVLKPCSLVHMVSKPGRSPLTSSPSWEFQISDTMTRACFWLVYCK